MAEILFVSLIHIIQQPDLYSGKPVRVVGVARVGMEATALYVSQDDLRNAVTKNALWLTLDPVKADTTLNGKYVIVEGVFDPNNKGHLRMYSGAITEVKRMELWSDPEQKQKAPLPK
jgi:hypothetical protein